MRLAVEAIDLERDIRIVLCQLTGRRERFVTGPGVPLLDLTVGNQPLLTRSKPIVRGSGRQQRSPVSRSRPDMTATGSASTNPDWW